MRLVAAFAGAVLLIGLGAPPGHAEKRVALAIGNGGYRNVAALPNTRNDADDIAGSLERLGFSVKRVIDGTFDDMRRALLQFGRDARGSEMAVIFFAGHGMEVGGENWLIPIDAELRSDSDAENEAISLKAAMLQVASATSLGLVILDSCRNNPFAAKMQHGSRYRAVDRGLARVEPTDNVLVAYAAKDGTTANDGNGRNSPFTTALLHNLETPGIEIRFLLASVRDEVMASTKREQQPFVYGSLSKALIYLKPPGSSATAAPIPAARPPDPCASAEAHWRSTETIGTVAAYEDHLGRFPNCAFAGLAQAKIETLKRMALAPAKPEPPSVRAIMGSWSGTVRQADSSSPYTARIQVEASGNGVFDYPTLNCGGTLTQVGPSDNGFEFQETLTFGQANCTAGNIVVVPVGNSLRWQWRAFGLTLASGMLAPMGR